MVRFVALIVLLSLVEPLQCSAQNTNIDSLDAGYLVLGGGTANGAGDRIGQFPKGGDSQDPVRKRFVELAGGPDAQFVIIHVPNGRESNDDRPLAERVASVSEMRSALTFGVKKMTALRLSDREAADSNEFVAPIRKANGVWLTGGDGDMLAKASKDSLLERELKGVLDR